MPERHGQCDHCHAENIKLVPGSVVATCAPCEDVNLDMSTNVKKDHRKLQKYVELVNDMRAFRNHRAYKDHFRPPHINAVEHLKAHKNFVEELLPKGYRVKYLNHDDEEAAELSPRPGDYQPEPAPEPEERFTFTHFLKGMRGILVPADECYICGESVEFGTGRPYDMAQGITQELCERCQRIPTNVESSGSESDDDVFG